jgi:hypothetical protein
MKCDSKAIEKRLKVIEKLSQSDCKVIKLPSQRGHASMVIAKRRDSKAKRYQSNCDSTASDRKAIVLSQSKAIAKRLQNDCKIIAKRSQNE